MARSKNRITNVENNGDFIEAQFVLDVGAFVLAAGDADRARPLDPRDLTYRRTDRTGGRRYHDGLAGLRLADVEQAGIGGHAGHAEHAHSR